MWIIGRASGYRFFSITAYNVFMKMNKLCGMEGAKMIIITRSMLESGCGFFLFYFSFFVFCVVCVHHFCLPQLMKEE